MYSLASHMSAFTPAQILEKLHWGCAKSLSGIF